MNASKSCVVLIFLLVLIKAPYGLASSTLLITAQTDKTSYYIEENINVYGDVTVDGVPVQDELVALEVHDPVDSPIITRTLETNASGTYSVVFKLSSEASLGTYVVHVSCTHDGTKATSTTSFALKQTSVLALTVKTGESYRIGETVGVQGNATFNGYSLSEVLVALEVQDPDNTPVVVRVVQTDIQGSYQLTFQMPTGSKTGNYTVHASVRYEELKAMANTTFRLRAQTPSADINGDGKVDIRDITVVAMAFGSEPGDENWNQIANLNGDEVIDIRDITIVAMEFGKTY